MKDHHFRWTILFLLFGMAGCFAPDLIRFPTLGANSSRAEKREYERYDPYPDNIAGPMVQGRPRSYDIQRTEPRRAAENSALLGTPAQTPSPFPDSAQQYPESVPQ